MKINMKTWLLLVITISIGLTACKNDKSDPQPQNTYACASCNNTPGGVAAYDASSAGLYKGVLTGSSGTFSIWLQNGNQDVKIIASFDGITDTLTTNDLDSWTLGTAITSAVFTGTKGITITFSVNADGSSPAVIVSITGHPDVNAEVAKETSANLVQCFEGTFSGAANGTFNFWLANGQFMGSAKSEGGTPDVMHGTLNGTVLTGTTASGVLISGSLSGDNTSGTWSNSSGNGTWTGKRTL